MKWTNWVLIHSAWASHREGFYSLHEKWSELLQNEKERDNLQRYFKWSLMPEQNTLRWSRDTEPSVYYTLGSQVSRFTCTLLKHNKICCPWDYDDISSTTRKNTNQTQKMSKPLRPSGIPNRDICIRMLRVSKHWLNVDNKMEHGENTQNQFNRNNGVNIQIWLRATISTLSLLSLLTQEKPSESEK